MKRSFVGLLLVLSLILPAGTVSAQAVTPTCDLNLNQVFLTLATAAVAWEVGNTQGALDGLAAAQEQIAAIQAACTGEPAPALSGSGKILVLDNIDSWSFDKLDALAFAGQIPLETTNDADAFFSELQGGEVTTVIWASTTDEESLLKLASFYEAGGAIVFPYFPSSTDQNQTLQEFFGVSIVEEEVLVGEDNIVRFPDSALPAWMAGLRVASYGEKIYAYIVAAGAGKEMGVVRSAQSDRERLVYYESPDGRLMFLPITRGENWSCWFDDQSIDLLDNEQAALALLRYLSGQTVSAAQAEPVAQGSPRPASVTDADIAAVEEIRTGVEAGSIDRDEANRSLAAIAERVGRDGFAWLMRQIPIYTEATGWISLDAYLQNEAAAAGVAPDSRLATDPVGVGVDLFFGDYDPEDLVNWLGIEN